MEVRKVKAEAVILDRLEWSQAVSLANVLAHLEPAARTVICAVALDLAEEADARPCYGR